MKREMRREMKKAVSGLMGTAMLLTALGSMTAGTAFADSPESVPEWWDAEQELVILDEKVDNFVDNFSGSNVTDKTKAWVYNNKAGYTFTSASASDEGIEPEDEYGNVLKITKAETTSAVDADLRTWYDYNVTPSTSYLRTLVNKESLRKAHVSYDLYLDGKSDLTLRFRDVTESSVLKDDLIRLMPNGKMNITGSTGEEATYDIGEWNHFDFYFDLSDASQRTYQTYVNNTLVASGTVRNINYVSCIDLVPSLVTDAYTLYVDNVRMAVSTEKPEDYAWEIMNDTFDTFSGTYFSNTHDTSKTWDYNGKEGSPYTFTSVSAANEEIDPDGAYGKVLKVEKGSNEKDNYIRTWYDYNATPTSSYLRTLVDDKEGLSKAHVSYDLYFKQLADAELRFMDATGSSALGFSPITFASTGGKMKFTQNSSGLPGSIDYETGKWYHFDFYFDLSDSNNRTYLAYVNDELVASGTVSSINYVDGINLKLNSTTAAYTLYLDNVRMTVPGFGVQISEDGATATAAAQVSGKSGDAYVLLLAQYGKDDQLLAVEPKELMLLADGDANISLPVTLDTNSTRIKAMLWNGLSNMMPLENAIELEKDEDGGWSEV